MAEEYPSNSNRAKNDKPAAPEKKVEAVVSGGAKTRKKSEAKKLADTFISEDAGNVKNYILVDVLIPAIKKAVCDIVTNGIEMILYGETGPRAAPSTTRKSPPAGMIVLASAGTIRRRRGAVSTMTR